MMRTPHPFVEPSLLRDRPFMLLNGLAMAAHMINFTLLFLLPQLLVAVHALSLLETGLMIFPGALLSVLLARPLGRALKRSGTRRLLALSPWCIVAGNLLLAWLGLSVPWIAAPAYLLTIVGCTAVNACVADALPRQIPETRLGAALGLQQLCQFIGGAACAAVCGFALADKLSELSGAAFTPLFYGLVLLSLLIAAAGLQVRNH
ncbi:putative MFS transporter [Paenibacillus sp. 598K]|nr:putative MFS transporter [Paenibacillus sp. 598K]